MAVSSANAEDVLKRMTVSGIGLGLGIIVVSLGRLAARGHFKNEKNLLVSPSLNEVESTFLVIALLVASCSLICGSLYMKGALASASAKSGMSDIADPGVHTIDDSKTYPYATAKFFLAFSTVFFALTAGLLLGNNPHQDAGKTIVGALSLLAGLYAAAVAATPAVVNGWKASTRADEQADARKGLFKKYGTF